MFKFCCGHQSAVVCCVLYVHYVVCSVQAFHSIVQLADARSKYPEFCIPMVIIPATISNNVPGTDFSLGSDTSLNEIADVRTSLLHSHYLSHCYSIAWDRL